MMGVEPTLQKDPMEIVPVTIARGLAAEGHCPKAAGQMEIVLSEGDRILVWGDVEAEALTRVLKALSRR
jgi:transposase